MLQHPHIWKVNQAGLWARLESEACLSEVWDSISPPSARITLMGCSSWMGQPTDGDGSPLEKGRPARACEFEPRPIRNLNS